MPVDAIASLTTGIFTAPKSIVDYTNRKLGLHAAPFQYGDSEKLFTNIDRALDNGAPVMVCGQPDRDPKGANLHWITVSGRYKDGKGKTYYIVDNPGGGYKYFTTKEDLDEFTSTASRFKQDRSIIVIGKEASQLNGLTGNLPRFYDSAAWVSGNPVTSNPYDSGAYAVAGTSKVISKAYEHRTEIAAATVLAAPVVVPGLTTVIKHRQKIVSGFKWAAGKIF
jgi:hypothetical protein